MIAYALGRIVQTLVVLTIIAFIGFLLVANLGDPLAQLLSPDATVQERAELIRALQLDQSAP